MISRIFEFIFILIISIIIGSIAQIDLTKGVLIFFAGIIADIIFSYLLIKHKIFSTKTNQIKLFVFKICAGILGFAIGFTGLIKLNVFTFDIIMIMVLVIFVFYVFTRELIDFFQELRNKKNKKIRTKN